MEDDDAFLYGDATAAPADAPAAAESSKDGAYATLVPASTVALLRICTNHTAEAALASSGISASMAA